MSLKDIRSPVPKTICTNTGHVHTIMQPMTCKYWTPQHETTNFYSLVIDLLLIPHLPTPQPQQMKPWQHIQKQNRDFRACSPKKIRCSVFISQTILRPKSRLSQLVRQGKRSGLSIVREACPPTVHYNLS